MPSETATILPSKSQNPKSVEFEAKQIHQESGPSTFKVVSSNSIAILPWKSQSTSKARLRCFEIYLVPSGKTQHSREIENEKITTILPPKSKPEIHQPEFKAKQIHQEACDKHSSFQIHPFWNFYPFLFIFPP